MAQTEIVSTVVKAVAAADGVNETELDSLYEYIDPDILRKLDDQEKGDWSFTFQYSDHQVTVTSEDQILVDGVAQTQSISKR